MKTIILKSILAKKGKCLMMFIQFTIGFLAILFGLSCYNFLYQHNKIVARLAPLDSLHIVADEEIEQMIGQEEEPTVDYDKYTKMYEKIKDCQAVENVALFERDDVVCDGESNSECEIYSLNEDALKTANFSLERGDMTDLINYKSGDVLPVILSYHFDKSWSVGEKHTLTYYTDEGESSMDIVVAGILQKDMNYWQGGSSDISNSLLGNQSYMVSPQFRAFTSDITYLYNNVITVNDKDAAEKEVSKILENTSFSVKEISEELEAYNEANRPVYVVVIAFSVILLLLALFGSIGAILASMVDRYREFGIYYSLGMRKVRITMLIIGEIFVIFAASVLTAIVLFLLMYTYLFSDAPFLFQGKVVIELCLIMSGLVLICSMFPAYRMKNMNAIDLMKGRE